jgi:hypothetical protein
VIRRRRSKAGVAVLASPAAGPLLTHTLVPLMRASVSRSVLGLTKLATSAMCTPTRQRPPPRGCMLRASSRSLQDSTAQCVTCLKGVGEERRNGERGHGMCGEKHERRQCRQARLES